MTEPPDDPYFVPPPPPPPPPGANPYHEPPPPRDRRGSRWTRPLGEGVGIDPLGVLAGAVGFPLLMWLVVRLGEGSGVMYAMPALAFAATACYLFGNRFLRGLATGFIFAVGLAGVLLVVACFQFINAF